MSTSRLNNIKYQGTLDFIFAQLPMYQRIGKSAFKKDLTNIKKLSEKLGNPHTAMKIIHIAGTNGKGSTSHMISSILQEYGYKVGLYTSPHYIDFRERIKINGQLISKSYVIDFVDKISSYLEEIQPSFFEITVAMAFDYFRFEKVDFAVVETGLGGRLDSTNIVDPLLSVITNISMDHMSMLGDNLIAIAGEKAGIIKKGRPVVIGERNEETDYVFIKKAQTVNSNSFFADELVTNNELRRNLPLLKNKSPFQKKNLRTSLAAIKVLVKESIIAEDKKQIESGLSNLRENTYYIGRWEILGENPKIIADSAHNEAGIKLVMQRIQSIDFKKLHIITGFANDKDIQKMLELFPIDAIYYFAKANIPRGMPAKELKVIAFRKGLKGRSYVSVINATRAAIRNASKEDLIFVVGSIFVVAEVLDYLMTSKRS